MLSTAHILPCLPLKPWQIRVVELHKNARGQKVSSSLKTITLSDRFDTEQFSNDEETWIVPRYHALHYSSGNLRLQNRIRFECDGRIFFIGRNIWEALVRLSESDLNCPIWVDAICINQRDEGEKVRQIQQMAEVYKQAQRVWTWSALPRTENFTGCCEIVQHD